MNITKTHTHSDPQLQDLGYFYDLINTKILTGGQDLTEWRDLPRDWQGSEYQVGDHTLMIIANKGLPEGLQERVFDTVAHAHAQWGDFFTHNWVLMLADFYHKQESALGGGYINTQSMCEDMLKHNPDLEFPHKTNTRVGAIYINRAYWHEMMSPMHTVEHEAWHWIDMVRNGCLPNSGNVGTTQQSLADIEAKVADNINQQLQFKQRVSTGMLDRALADTYWHTMTQYINTDRELFVHENMAQRYDLTPGSREAQQLTHGVMESLRNIMHNLHRAGVPKGKIRQVFQRQLAQLTPETRQQLRLKSGDQQKYLFAKF